VAFLGLYDLANHEWWPEALHRFGVDDRTLSKPLRPGSMGGRTSARATDLLGVNTSVAVAVGGLDHHVAAIGSGLERLADASISTGTVLAALVLVDKAMPYAGCYHGGHVDGVRLWRLAFDPNGAGQLEDYQRGVAPERSIEALLAEAALVLAGAAWRKATDHGSAVRAILERVALTHRALIRSVVGTVDNLGLVRSVVATGGGARSPLWLQINADILGVPVVTPACSERACLGAAAFAAVAAGLYPTINDATMVMIRPERVFEPNREAVSRYWELGEKAGERC
jgi:sugar (pentulose or hexulose) kinase